MEAKIFGLQGINRNRGIFKRERCQFAGFYRRETVVPMIPACNYKRIKDNDEGPNTGGMGSYSPPGNFTNEMSNQVLKSIIEPTVKALAGRDPS